MTRYARQEVLVGLGKETTRGTAPASLDIVIPVDPGSEFEYTTALIDDEKIRGIKERFKPAIGIKEGAGTISAMEVEAGNIGYFLNSLLGSVTTTTPPNATNARRHIFTRASGTQNPSYTFVFDRVIGKKQYTLSVVKSMTLTVPMDGVVMADFDIPFKSEATSALSMPAVVSPDRFKFYQIDVGIGSTNVASESWGTGNGVLVTFAKQLANTKIAAGSLSITDTVETFSDNGDCTLTGSLGGSGVINYATGYGSITFNTAPADTQAITASYDYRPSSIDIRELSLVIDNGTVGQRALTQDQDVQDVLTFAKLLLNGTFTYLFGTETERDKFIAGNSTGIQFVITGTNIETDQDYLLAFEMPLVYYSAYPYGESDGILAAAVAFNAYYKVASAHSIVGILINTDTAY